jgi:hypothetical protein
MHNHMLSYLVTRPLKEAENFKLYFMFIAYQNRTSLSKTYWKLIVSDLLILFLNDSPAVHKIQDISLTSPTD